MRRAWRVRYSQRYGVMQAGSVYTRAMTAGVHTWPNLRRWLVLAARTLPATRLRLALP